MNNNIVPDISLVRRWQYIIISYLPRKKKQKSLSNRTCASIPMLLYCRRTFSHRQYKKETFLKKHGDHPIERTNLFVTKRRWLSTGVSKSSACAYVSMCYHLSNNFFSGSFPILVRSDIVGQGRHFRGVKVYICISRFSRSRYLLIHVDISFFRQFPETILIS